MLRYIAYFFTVVFHPLLILSYMLIILLLVNPYLFGVSHIGDGHSIILILIIFLSTFFIPFFSVLMLKFLDFIESLEMQQRSDRTVPYIITAVIYLSIFRYLLHFPKVPEAYKSFVLGSIIGLFIAFFINLFSKISAHAVGMGGLLGMIVITMLLFSYDGFALNLGSLGIFYMSTHSLLIITILLTGIVGTSRMILNAHNLQDLYGGFLVGFSAQFIALRFFI
ncbi:MAG: hypothetical protein AB8G15_13490 [Saprospiraceae bacterium]